MCPSRVHQHGVFILGYVFPNISHMKYRTDLILGEGFCIFIFFLFPRFWTFCINWFEIFGFEGVIVKTENTDLQLDKIARKSRYVYTVRSTSLAAKQVCLGQ